jgi:hypothetical protein
MEGSFGIHGLKQSQSLFAAGSDLDAVAVELKNSPNGIADDRRVIHKQNPSRHRRQ